ncbi:hypothetical protein DMY09_23820, partial [Shigella flexneri]|nr:hypothetical protein [Shigella flexneri]
SFRKLSLFAQKSRPREVLTYTAVLRLSFLKNSGLLRAAMRGLLRTYKSPASARLIKWTL